MSWLALLQPQHIFLKALRCDYKNAIDYMTELFKPLLRRQGPDPRSLIVSRTPSVIGSELASRSAGACSG